jgi:urease accessory protein
MSAPLRAGSVKRRGAYEGIPFDIILLAHDERRLRRKLLTCIHADEVLVDLAETTTLDGGDVLVLDDGRLVEIIACEEPLLEVRGQDARHLSVLAWHIGNRHLAAQIEHDRILILYDHVIGHMLEHLGAAVTRVSEQFYPEGGAYGGAHQAHDHGDHAHDHGHHPYSHHD